MEELQDALRRAHDTSAGSDEVHYQLLKNLASVFMTSCKILISLGHFHGDTRYIFANVFVYILSYSL